MTYKDDNKVKFSRSFLIVRVAWMPQIIFLLLLWWSDTSWLENITCKCPRESALDKCEVDGVICPEYSHSSSFLTPKIWEVSTIILYTNLKWNSLSLFFNKQFFFHDLKMFEQAPSFNERLLLHRVEAVWLTTVWDLCTHV